jgi:hypothetical protein
VAYPIQWGARCNQPADSGNWLAAIVSIAGISLPLQIKQIISGTPISAISQLQEAYCCYKSQNRFPAGNAGKLSAVDLNGLSTISYCSGRPIELDKPHIFGFSR